MSRRPKEENFEQYYVSIVSNRLKTTQRAWDLETSYECPLREDSAGHQGKRERESADISGDQLFSSLANEIYFSFQKFKIQFVF